MFENDSSMPTWFSEMLRRAAMFVLGAAMVLFLGGIPYLIFNVCGTLVFAVCLAAFLAVPALFLVSALQRER